MNTPNHTCQHCHQKSITVRPVQWMDTTIHLCTACRRRIQNASREISTAALDRKFEKAKPQDRAATLANMVKFTPCKPKTE